MADRTDVPDILKPANLPPEFQELNADARAEFANGSVTDLGNAPGGPGTPASGPPVASLAWMRDLEPPPAEDGVPAELRDTPPSALTSEVPIYEGDRPPSHRQSGVSPGNAESEDFDWDHPSGA